VNLSRGRVEVGDQGGITLQRVGRLVGSDQNDTAVVGPARGRIEVTEFDGGGGDNTADFSRAPVAVQATLSRGRVEVGDQGSVTLARVGRLVGTDHDDGFDSGPQRLRIPVALDGGAGVDALGFQRAPGPVRIAVADGTATGADVGSVTFANLEEFTGSGFNDILLGSDAADRLNAGEGDDELEGAGGVDTLRGGDGADLLFGGGDNDAEFAGGGLFGGDGGDRIEGNAGDDDLFGQAGLDTLLGGDGADILDGGPGGTATSGDILDGGDGADLVIGGAGWDDLTGGAGGDTFRYRDIADARQHFETIRDFVQGEDVVDLAGIDAIAGTGEDDAFDFIGTAAFTAAGQLRFLQFGGSTFVEMNVDANLATNDGVLQLLGSIDLAAGDFVV
jgi:Ca2+-binding RTX toxin-like protein